MKLVATPKAGICYA